ncbi:MAG: YceI family protein [Weeksellaceae bacterium]|nr:YceI family protein [Weeksellaceae bacterium]
MKTTKMLITTGMFLGVLIIPQLSNAQKIAQKATSITVLGTSPLHDWEMKGSAGTFSGIVSGNSVTNINFSVPAKTLKAEQGKTMEKKAYDALKADKVPTITFTATSINLGKSNAAGKLSIAGITKNASFPVSIVKKGNSYLIDATETINLSDFGMERPGFMGIRTGDVVTVKVNVVAE